MNLIRFTIGEMMALVLLIALNIGASKALGMGNPSPPAHLSDLLASLPCRWRTSWPSG
jgi:hypothetical protein